MAASDSTPVSRPGVSRSDPAPPTLDAIAAPTAVSRHIARYDPAAFGSGNAALIRIVWKWLASAAQTSSFLNDTVTSRTMLSALTPTAPNDTIASSRAPNALTRPPSRSVATNSPSPSSQKAAAGIAPNAERSRK